MTRKRILYIHHGNSKGGGFLSLLYLLKSLNTTLYEPVICNGGDEQDPQVEAIFSAEGFSTCRCLLPRFAHTLGAWNLLKYSGWKQFLQWVIKYKDSKLRLADLLNDLKPDLVHLNSLTLAPYAKISTRMGIPNIVHVREPIVNGLFGLRRKWLTEQLNCYANEAIVICKDNFDRLQPRKELGRIIYNPVDFKKFDASIDKKWARIKLKVDYNAKVVLFAGGAVQKAKGLYEFLEAMNLVKDKFSNFVCMMPSFQEPADPSQMKWTFKRRIARLLGMFRTSTSLFRLFNERGLNKKTIRSDFVYDIENWLAACDIVCVPHMQPHFSRTVIEAGAMKRPVIGFDVGGVREVIQNGKTGIIVPRGDVIALANAVNALLEDTNLSKKLGEGGYQQAIEKFDALHSAKQVEDIYKKLIH